MSAHAFPRIVENDTTRRASYYDLEESSHMFPGERVGAPLRRRGLSPAAKVRLIMLAAATGGAALAVGDRGGLDWATASIAGLTSTRVAQTIPGKSEPERGERLPGEPGPATTEPAPPPLPDAVAEEKAEASTEAAAVPYDAAAAPEAAGTRLEPPVIDRDDPYQAKALAAGLHPGLSRVLLAKLTAEDYGNAGKAIQMALAETPDDGTLTWPKKPGPGRALFEVHFVPGAVAECRRYVVTITLSGWSTTALPMERCGGKEKNAQAG